MADKNEGEVEIGKIQQSEDTTSVDNSDRSKEQGCSLDDFGKETNNGSVTIEKALSKEGAKSLLSNGLKQIIVPCIEAIDGRVEATQKSQEALRQALDKLEQGSDQITMVAKHTFSVISKPHNCSYPSTLVLY